MAYEETTQTSYGQRLTGSLKGIAAGFVMFIAGTALLFWNEGNFVKTKKSIQEAEQVMVSVDNVSSIDPALNGKLIHASAFADTQDILKDGMFGINEKAIAINRKVEYYQNEEHSSTRTKDKLGGGQEKVTTYTYEKTWVSNPVDSKKFKDPEYRSSNFVLTKIEGKTEQAKNVTFGAYKLPPFIISSISGNIPINVKLSGQELTLLQNQTAKTMAWNGRSPAGTIVHVEGNTVYFGQSASNPAIGDVRVTLTKIMPTDISIIAKVVSNTFEQYITSNGKTFSKVSMGTVSAETMFQQAHSSNSTLTWILRLLGVFMVVLGLKSMFGILPALFKVVPFLGSIVGAGIGLVCAILGGVWSLIIIAIAWLFYRPLVAIPMLVLAIAGIWYLKQKGKKAKTEN